MAVDDSSLHLSTVADNLDSEISSLVHSLSDLSTKIQILKMNIHRKL